MQHIGSDFTQQTAIEPGDVEVEPDLLIAERRHRIVDLLRDQGRVTVDALAHRAVWIAGGLFLLSLVCGLQHHRITDQSFRRCLLTLMGDL